MNAIEAIKISNVVNDFSKNEEYLHIIKRIKNEAEEGKYCISQKEQLSTEVWHKLTEDGFKVNFIESNIFISW